MRPILLFGSRIVREDRTKNYRTPTANAKKNRGPPSGDKVLAGAHHIAFEAHEDVNPEALIFEAHENDVLQYLAIVDVAHRLPLN